MPADKRTSDTNWAPRLCQPCSMRHQLRTADTAVAPGIQRRGLLVLALTVVLGGCAIPGESPQPADVRPQRLQRKAEAARSFDAQRDQAEFTDALSSWQQGDLAGCRQTLDRLLGRNSLHRDAALLRAEVARAESKPADAVPHLERLAAAQPDDAEVQHALARLHQEIETSAVTLAGYHESPPTSNVDGFAESDDATGQENPAIAGCLAAAGECLRGGDAGGAARLAQQGLQAHPNSAALYRTMGLAYYRQGDYPSAERALRQSLSLDNSSALAYFLLGSALQRLGDAEAAECFRRARSLDARF